MLERIILYKGGFLFGWLVGIFYCSCINSDFVGETMLNSEGMMVTTLAKTTTSSKCDFFFFH
jgi:hypothetical protein